MASRRHARVSGSSTPMLRSSDFTCAGFRRSQPVMVEWRNTSASRAVRCSAASVSFLGRGPTKEATIVSAMERSIGSPSNESSAHSSSAADSDRAVDAAFGRSPTRASAASCTAAAAAASSAHRAMRSVVHSKSAASHSGLMYPSARSGSSGRPSSSGSVKRSSAATAGRCSTERSCSRAHALAGSIRHPPTSSRCTAATSQHFDTRRPPSTSTASMSRPHSTHRGRNAASTVATSATGSPLATDIDQPSASANAAPTLGCITSARKPPRSKAARLRSSSSRWSVLATGRRRTA